MLTRRDVLKSSSLLALAPAVPLFLAHTAPAAADKDGRALVVVQLDGGNDALNTAVPHADPEYAKHRPRLKVPANKVIALSDSVGLHPKLKPLDKLLQAGQLATVVGVGYPNPNRSHFESMAIWHTASTDPEDRNTYGWIGRALDPSAGSAFAIGTAVPRALRGRQSQTVTLNGLSDVALADANLPVNLEPAPADDVLSFVRRQTIAARTTADRLGKLKAGDSVTYPATGLAERLKLIAQLLKADLGARVFYTLQSGYDTHSAQLYGHANLLAEFAGAVAAFFVDLHAAKLAERVTLLAFSEFGRTLSENDSAGTDHGTAGVVFLTGPTVRGGLHGTMPVLTELVGGEPRMSTDFRRVYAGVLDTWLRLPAAAILKGSFEPVNLFRS